MTTILFTNPGYQTWTVPHDWSNSNSFEVISGGAGGVAMFSGGAGGSGGGYARTDNIAGLVPGQTIYIYVSPSAPGTYGATSNPGGPSWINVVTNAVPVNVGQGVAAVGAAAGYIFAVGAVGYGSIGNYGSAGGRGDPSTAGGGAGGPHGNGLNAANFETGGAGDAGHGGGGGISTPSYNAINMGGNGPDNGSGGGAAYDPNGFGGNGGLYGGGGAGSGSGAILSGTGAQGIAKITYTPLVPLLPKLPPPNTTPLPPPPPCVPSGFDTATQAQIYWAYGTWQDPFSNVGYAHYDSNYQQLLSLVGDDDQETFDGSYNTTLPWNFINERENYYLDFPRAWKSRSNEWIDDGGQKSIWMRHRTLIGDFDCVPNIDNPSGYVTLLTNMLFMDEQTYGYRLSYSNNIGIFNPGDVVTQQISANVNVSGTVYMMDPEYIYVNIPVGPFLKGYSIVNAFNPSVNAMVVASTEINEKYSANVFPGQSRYISKSTILTSGQDAEDLQIFMTAYRPTNSNFKVYGKVISSFDPGKFSDRIWTRLVESNTTSPSFSSLTNPNDYVDVKYDLPISQLLFSNLQSCSCANNSLSVSVPGVTQFFAGQYIYLSSPGQGTFNIRQIINIPNSTSLTVSSFPSFSNTSNLNVGIIPGLEDPTSVFQYDQNSNMARYVTSNDVFFDTFNQFAVKIVPISDNPVICPTVTEFRSVALQAGT